MQRRTSSSRGFILKIDEYEHRQGFHPEYAGKRAECDGGAPIPGTRFASRMDFAGVLTGDYAESGTPPLCWRWYLMTDLTLKPENWEGDSLWCLEGNIFLSGER